MVFDLIYNDKLPEKWKRYWQEIKSNYRELILFEILISEIFYQLSKNYGFSQVRNKLLQIKSLKSTRLVKVDDRIALNTGKYKIKYHDLSLVDSYILAFSKHYNAKIVTTDFNIKKACKKEKIKIDFLPLEEVKI